MYTTTKQVKFQNKHVYKQSSSDNEQCIHSFLVVIHADKNAKQNPFSFLVNKFLWFAKHRLYDRAAIIQQRHIHCITNVKSACNLVILSGILNIVTYNVFSCNLKFEAVNSPNRHKYIDCICDEPWASIHN